MRRGGSSITRYIESRITLLKNDLQLASDTYDKMWYKRLIQELDWALEMESKPKENCTLLKRGIE
jgi:hypothetical protein